ncbi:MAG: dienelactone hydrolase family protein [Caldilineaceae bacterium]
MGHFAENDPYEEEEYIVAMEKGIREAGRPVTFHTYPGTGHWFFEADRIDAFHPEAADLAWQRTLAFLKESA